MKQRGRTKNVQRERDKSFNLKHGEQLDDRQGCANGGDARTRGTWEQIKQATATSLSGDEECVESGQLNGTGMLDTTKTEVCSGGLWWEMTRLKLGRVRKN